MQVIRRLVLALLLLALAGASQADDLAIGFKSEVTSADPHVLNGANRNIWNHVYESLVGLNSQLRPVPGLALSWTMLSPTVWEFRLRPNVRFHNGELMTADDVKYSIERAMQVPGARTFRSYLKNVASVAVSSPLTIQVTSKRPGPTLPENLGMIAVLPRSLGSKVAEHSFAEGRSAIGTGPYKYVSWSHGQQLVLARNAAYWGEQEPWNKVTFRFVPREPARAAALLSGSVDVINDVTSHMVGSFRNYPMSTNTSYMLLYLGLDQFREQSLYVTDHKGNPLPDNPFRQRKVRQALTMAINRPAIIRFLMKGDGTASDQLVPKGFFGYDATLASPAHDMQRARSLLAEAGYPQGFRMTIHCTNNRYVNDARLCEAVAQMFSKVGVRTSVATMPFPVFQTRVTGGGADGKPEFSAFLAGMSAVTGDSIAELIGYLHTYDRKALAGVGNYGRYTNQAVDALIDQAAVTADNEVREDLQRQAARLALDDAAVIPLLHLNSTWAMRQGLVLTPRADGFTMATHIRKQKP